MDKLLILLCLSITNCMKNNKKSEDPVRVIEADELLNKVKKYNPNADLELIRKAYNLGRNAHKGQKRNSGEEYFIHPLAVTLELIKLKADSATICAALLHDVVEDTTIKPQQIKVDFGDEILFLIEGLTKISKIHFDNKEDYKAENIRKIILATIKDIRIIIIKMCDRLHNMQTLKHMKPEKQKAISQETLEIFAPIAEKLGMFNLKTELEDLSMRYLMPKVYQYFKQKINKKREEREIEVKRLTGKLKSELSEKSVEVKISGRAKSFFSIYKKMIKKNKDFNEIYDLNAIRIITQNIPDCYTALGVVHSVWKPMPGKFKDYISVPKSNNYQSLHTVVITDKGKVLEIQIRNEKMHAHAEEGVAAHWRYKGTEQDKLFDKKIMWVKQILNWRFESSNAHEFVENLKIDLFKDEIVVFTPKGDPISLPENSTPIDFAFRVHTEVGSKASQAKVNNAIAALDQKLHSGDIVEIITSKTAKPSRQWLNSVVTTQAKTKIRQLLNIKIDQTDSRRIQKELMEKQNQDSENLLDLVEVKAKRADIKISKCCNPKFEDRIVAFKTKDKKITIHKYDCPNIYALDTNKGVDIAWKKKDTTIKKHITLELEDKIGVLARILTLISNEKIVIGNLNTKVTKTKTRTNIELIPKTELQYEVLLEKLQSIPEILNLKEKE